MGSIGYNSLLLKKSSWWRGDHKPFSNDETGNTPKVEPIEPSIIPGKLDTLKKEEVKQIVPGKLDTLPAEMTNIIFKKKEQSKTKIDPINLSSNAKEASFNLLDINPTTIVENVVKDVVQNVVEKTVDTLKGIRIKELPTHDLDFASSWYYTNFNDVQPENITTEYNAYLQIIKELKENKIKLPRDFDGPTVAYDLDSKILKDFREKNLKYNPDDNLIHRAWFAHCVKRAISNLREGLFVDESGYKEKRPELADVLERRIDQIILENTLYKNI